MWERVINITYTKIVCATKENVKMFKETFGGWVRCYDGDILHVFMCEVIINNLRETIELCRYKVSNVKRK